LANMGMSTRQFLVLARRHAWLVVVLAVLSAGGAYLLTSRQTPMYSATAQLLYSPGVDLSNPLGTQVYVDPNAQQLQILGATTMITSPDIERLVQSAVGTQSTWPSYSVQASVSTSSQPGQSTSYSTGLAVTVTAPDAQWAAKLANAYAQQLIEWRTKNEQAAIASAEAVLSSKIKDLEARGQRASSDYAILTGNLQGLEIRAATATGDFTVAVPATAPAAPYAPKPMKSAILGLGVGILIGLGVAFLREKLDTRVRSHRDVAELLGLPILGRIPLISSDVLQEGSLVALTQADGPAANALRVLRANLEFASLGDEHHALMIVSALQGEGKSLTLANLATSLALAGKRVLLVDGDLRRPQMHKMFDVPNRAGVSSVIAGQVQLGDAIQPSGPLVVRTRTASTRLPSGTVEALDTSTPRLWLLTAGPPPPNPGEMIGSQRFASLIGQLKSMPFDTLLVDSPAFLAVGDALALAADVDGVLLLTNLKMTRRPLLEDAKEFLAQMPAQALGVVTVKDDADHDEYYRYYGDR